ncbi:PAS-domain containing phosphoglycerate kinase, putative [Trypanosoma cruzi]|uniref:Phosphoglycerate kinase n=3 Tax=Trypanosoma cruzi TaxID=5693 RepID=Q4DX96_TRYCC|nr:PAS-domain containing phosphoglycerate kinase, putative [Trypanosoma cruzi]ESS69068.1 PAS-domain containing phosphoglycerate kinase [Trypanosoma cruzi Dm28c]PBJ80963.1 PAS-domain containing phosphoglycerate kinase [Trypanosoma cruzi cruzi]EAN97117.1 PAS-domain containing phosphoglycerate kinase, putative [Trypanosoma cruzi]EKG05550.1 PAS-domain containing phosphoglycerate kinase, putative [Trypanosoma cruzi]PWU96747.1 putative PAS-domain containing phosphoglycerate kinase [Trypanosoma cruzi|eukprot:XP_818968.1 PAS-domain containing phosphoglycerate kinase [Trypanosoma cruzi strain CL Brener]
MLQHSKIDMIFKSLRDVVVVGDNDMVILDMNRSACDFFGWSVEEVRGKSITFLIPKYPLDVSDGTVTLVARLKNSVDIPVVIQSTRDPHASMVGWTILPIILPRVFDFGVHMNLRAALTPKLSVDDLDFQSRRVFVRVDFNVPFDKATQNIRDDSRIRASIPTIMKIVRDGGRVIVASHLGRPKKPDDRHSLKRILPRFEELLGKKVVFCPSLEEAPRIVNAMKNGEIMLLENLRFFPGEDATHTVERNRMALKLASFIDIYVCDAFGTVHRMTASMTGLPRILGAGVTGYLIDREIRAISMAMHNPTLPLLCIVGGAKVSDKITVLSSIMNFAQTIIIGGAMAYTFLEAQGHSCGNSRVERTAREKGRDLDLHAIARELIDRARAKKVRIILPVDHNCAKSFSNEVPFTTSGADIPDGYMALDFGPKTNAICSKAVAECRTLLWNGPVGVFEFSNFATGTVSLAEAIQRNDRLVSIVGGGETAAATKRYKSSITHTSTGGGAFLELLQGKALPGLICLTAQAEPRL